MIVKDKPEMIESDKSVLVLVCGIPGSGKSRLCTSLFKMINSRGKSCTLLEIDVIEKMLNTSSNQQINMVDLIIQQLHTKYLLDEKQLDCNESYSFQAESWKKSRKMAQEITSQLFSVQKHQIIIVEDVFNLNSMRREYQLIAKDVNCGFVIINVHITLQQAINNDRSRIISKQVGEEVIKKAFNSFDSERKEEEKHWIAFCQEQSDGNIDKQQQINNYDEVRIDRGDSLEKSYEKLIDQILKIGLLSVEICGVEDSQLNSQEQINKRERDIKSCQESLEHLLDLQIRERIAEIFKENKGNNKLGPQLSALKKLYQKIVNEILKQRIPQEPTFKKILISSLTKEWSKAGVTKQIDEIYDQFYENINNHAKDWFPDNKKLSIECIETVAIQFSLGFKSIVVTTLIHL